jgi:hypothetical protein
VHLQLLEVCFGIFLDALRDVPLRLTRQLRRRREIASHAHA